MNSVQQEIRDMVDCETRAWDEQDAEALVSLFHPDMVWPWPPDSGATTAGLWRCPDNDTRSPAAWLRLCVFAFFASCSSSRPERAFGAAQA